MQYKTTRARYLLSLNPNNTTIIPLHLPPDPLRPPPDLISVPVFSHIIYQDHIFHLDVPQAGCMGDTGKVDVLQPHILHPGEVS